MRRLHVVGFAAAGVLALCAFMAASAFAASEWLVNGESAKAGTEATTTGELSLEDKNALIKVDILCSGILPGQIGATEDGTIVKLLNLSGEEQLAESLAKETVPAVSCTISKAGACSSPKEGELIWILILHLPWTTVVELPSTELWVNTITKGTGGEPGYEMTCTTSLLGTVTDVCTFKPSATLTNETGGVQALFEENETINKPGNCSVGGEKEFLVVSVGASLIALTGSGTLTVS
jgi:hypothetical protein